MTGILLILLTLVAGGLAAVTGADLVRRRVRVPVRIRSNSDRLSSFEQSDES